MTRAELLSLARRFSAGDPDPETRSELERLITRAGEGDVAALADLEDRFRGPLEFGTAGLRGIIGAGETRMNRAVVARATYGLVRHLVAVVPNAAERGLVIGRDARRMSRELQAEAAEIALAAGFAVYLIDEVSPTPVVPFAVERYGAAGGVMVTASHNPPAYNGYKVYWDNGAQIIPPVDAGIAREIASAPPANVLPRITLAEARAAQGGRLPSGGRLEDATPVIDRYVAAISSIRVAAGVDPTKISLAYTALHGVGERTFRRVMAARGFTRLTSVAEQAEPDGAFPTVEFPNPEEPGALDRLLALARREGADVAIANDPDADRLGVAARDAKTGRWVVFDGNEIGALLGHHLLTRQVDPPADRLVIATIVSSQLLGRMARALGVRYAETLTGFKWIANEAIAIERATGARFTFGYEEALGYTVGTTVRDKDGISAALVMAELAALLAAEGRTLVDELEQIRRRYGFLVGRQKSVTMPGQDGRERIRRAMQIVRSEPLVELAGEPVASVWDLEAKQRRFADGRLEELPRWSGDVVVIELGGERPARIAVRPSGTEPKLKLYFEVVEVLADGEPPSAAEARGRERLDHLTRALLELTHLA